MNIENEERKVDINNVIREIDALMKSVDFHRYMRTFPRNETSCEQTHDAIIFRCLLIFRQIKGNLNNIDLCSLEDEMRQMAGTEERERQMAGTEENFSDNFSEEE